MYPPDRLPAPNMPPPADDTDMTGMQRVEVYLPTALVKAVDKAAKATVTNRRDVIHAALLKALPDITAEECQAVQVRGRRGKGPRPRPKADEGAEE